MNNKEIIESVIDAFDKNNAVAALNLMTEDIEWNMVADRIIAGKEQLKKFFIENAEIKMLTSTKDQIIIDGDRAAVDGDVQCTGKNGEVMDMHYCDIYELEKGKVKKIVSYIVNKKK